MTETFQTLCLRDLTIGSMCRIGITLSSCFWLPAAAVLGLATAAGVVPDLAGGAQGLTGFISGFLRGIGCSIANDAMVVLGAFSFAAMRTFGVAPDIVLTRRPAQQQAPEPSQ